MNSQRRTSVTDCPAPALDVTVADELFAALDGQTVASDGEAWEVQVRGIHGDGRGCWLQVHLLGAQELDATLLVDPGQPAAILREFGGWLGSASSADVLPAISPF